MLIQVSGLSDANAVANGVYSPGSELNGKDSWSFDADGETISISWDNVSTSWLIEGNVEYSSSASDTLGPLDATGWTNGAELAEYVVPVIATIGLRTKAEHLRLRNQAQI